MTTSTCHRAKRPGLLVRWWAWKTARKYRKAAKQPDVMIGLDIEIIGREEE